MQGGPSPWPGGLLCPVSAGPVPAALGCSRCSGPMEVDAPTPHPPCLFHSLLCLRSIISPAIFIINMHTCCLISPSFSITLPRLRVVSSGSKAASKLKLQVCGGQGRLEVSVGASITFQDSAQHRHVLLPGIPSTVGPEGTQGLLCLTDPCPLSRGQRDGCVGTLFIPLGPSCVCGS